MYYVLYEVRGTIRIHGGNMYLYMCHVYIDVSSAITVMDSTLVSCLLADELSTVPRTGYVLLPQEPVQLILRGWVGGLTAMRWSVLMPCRVSSALWESPLIISA